jgi:hypothetical protein
MILVHKEWRIVPCILWGRLMSRTTKPMRRVMSRKCWNLEPTFIVMGHGKVSCANLNPSCNSDATRLYCNQSIMMVFRLIGWLINQSGRLTRNTELTSRFGLLRSCSHLNVGTVGKLCTFRSSLKFQSN